MSAIPEAPLREGGFHMRLLETRKTLEEAHCTLSRIENSAGIEVPTSIEKRDIGSPMNVDQMINELRQSAAELLDRLGRLERTF